MGFTKSLIIVCFAGQAIAAAAAAGERAGFHGAPATVLCEKGRPRHHAIKDPRAAVTPLDRVASAVDGAESSHGRDLAMWRPDPSGPQGPMQVSEAAATDVGGGDRFDLAENRAIGRAYLLQLFWRYKNWPDAIAAYNWGLGKMDAWVKAGRPSDKFLVGVAVYLKRVLHESGLCESAEAAVSGMPKSAMEGAKEPVKSPADLLIDTACSAPVGFTALAGLPAGPSRFYNKLEAGLRLALQRSSGSR
jgi:Transglycosylase SLT domain